MLSVQLYLSFSLMRASSEIGLQRRIHTNRTYYCCETNFMTLNCSQNAESYCYIRILFELVNILVWSTISTQNCVRFSLFYVIVSACVLMYVCISVGFFNWPRAIKPTG
jgi:hypothetical protein